ncbi:MAG: hypothetical protein MKZ75_04865 [Acidimicrobiales bacterium]|nr:hypothetical protein [Acidimicrobiales bacterium]MEC9113756.1 hypothetical protein [Actinomycetota bacterium]
MTIQTSLPWRLTRLGVGLVLFGVGLALVVIGDFGLPPWDIFHQGLAEQTWLTIGTAMILVGVVLLIALLALREPLGFGTLANVLVIGLVVDAAIDIGGNPSNSIVRALCTFLGPLVVALGSGFYIGARLGPGPRDGLMTALDRRGIAIWKARTFIEGAALACGLVMGGTIGWGTVWFVVSIGPAVQFFLRRLDTQPNPEPE